MAIRTWGRMLLAGLGAAAFAGAAQLGFAYGLAVVRFGRTFDRTAEGLWAAQVAWLAWFAIVAAVAGSIAVRFLANRYAVPVTGIAPRLAAAGAAAIGALAVAPLAMVPARAAQLTSINPALTAGLGAVLGALIGTGAGVAALSQRPFRWNILLVAGSVWLVTLLSVAPSLGPTDPLPDVRLGVVDAASLSEAARGRLAVLTMPSLALVAGLVCGLLARAGRYSTVVAAGCGAIGPALLALAYLAAGPGGGDGYQAAPYWGALIATGAGALGSVLTTVIPLPGTARSRDASRGRRVGAGRPQDARTAERVPGEPAAWDAPTEVADSTDRPAEGPTETWKTFPAPDHDPAGAAGTITTETSTTTTDTGTAATWGDDAGGGESSPTPEPGHSDEAVRGRLRRTPRPVYPREDEYVDWVSGLGGSEERSAADPETRRTSRRSTPPERD